MWQRSGWGLAADLGTHECRRPGRPRSQDEERKGREPEKQEGQVGGRSRGFRPPPAMEWPEAELEEPKLSSEEV